jgi:type VI secretion system protein ImpJ
VLMLQQLNVAYSKLRVTAFAKGIHPLTAYHELCGIIGTLSLFAADRRAEEPPLYDHDDLYTIFDWAKRKIDALLESGPRDEYEQRPFIGAGLGMQVSLEDRWLNADWKWFVGVQHENINEEECAELLQPGNLDWKLGSKTRVEMLFDHGLPGLHLVPLSSTPRALPRRSDWRFYEVNRQGSEWKEVSATKTLAMRFKHRLIQNPEALAGQRRIAVNYRGKRADLEFALFAVRAAT